MMISFKDQKTINFKLICLVVLSLPEWALAGEIVSAWEVYANPGVVVQAEKSLDVVRGERRALVDPLLTTLTIRTTYDDVNKYYFGWLDYYHLVQTINAQKYQGKHLHISGYVKIDQMKVKSHIETYKVWLEKNKRQQHRIDDGIVEFIYIPDRILNQYDALPALSELSMYVYIHTKEGIYRYRATSDSVLSASEWQRLNVEVDLPKDSIAVTISLFFKGVGQLFVDHLAVVEQGKALKGVSQRIKRKHQPKLYDKLRGWEKKYSKRKRFTNLSFEKVHSAASQ